MRVKWLGHAAFLLVASDGTRIITDPYQPGAFDGAVNYGPIREPADFVTVSHDHLDHNHIAGLPGKPVVVRSAAARQAGAVKVTGFDSFHDDSRGSARGRNIIFLFDDAGLRVCHLGDLGHVPAAQAKVIGRVDVLLMPVGGHFTIGPAEAHEVAALLGARVVVPMHFATAKTDMPITGVEEFAGGRPNVKQFGASEVEITAATLPAGPEIWILEHAL